jgi:hypothetical protein
MLDAITRYGEDKFVSEGISFFVQGGSLYIPFLAAYFPKTPGRAIAQVDLISFVTQKMLLLAFYEKWGRMRMAEIAKKMGVSQMTATRIFDEIEGLGLPLISRTGKYRFFDNRLEPSVYFDTVMAVLRSPVKKICRLAHLPPDSDFVRYGGMSAISHYSMLADDRIPTFAVMQKDVQSVGLPALPSAPPDDEPACIVQVHGYLIDYGDRKAIDPISTMLSVSKFDKDDPRVEGALEEIRENILL